MRPRITSFGKITRKELSDYFTNNYVFGSTVEKHSDGKILYTYYMMFRHNKKQPEQIYVEVSGSSKIVLRAWSNNGIVFKNVDDLKSYTKK